jgi:hypothetical protein
MCVIKRFIFNRAHYKSKYQYKYMYVHIIDPQGPPLCLHESNKIKAYSSTKNINGDIGVKLFLQIIYTFSNDWGTETHSGMYNIY